MPWSFPGIYHPVECVYTQTRGVHADVALLKFLPQVQNLPSSGNLTLSWGAESCVVSSCVVDTSSLQYHADGIHHTVRAKDKRELWTMAPPISGYYNTYRSGEKVPERIRSLRDLITLLLTQMGVTSRSTSLAPNDVYPEVRWMAEAPHLALEKLLRDHGLDITLGFGSNPVTIVVAGTGEPLPVGNEYMQSLTSDPKLRPEYIRTVFGPSRMQARFSLIAVGLDTDGSWKPIEDLSYAPGGWLSEDPYTLPTVLATEGEEVWNKARTTVFRAYQIIDFPGRGLALPDGSMTLSNIEDVLPLIPRRLDTEDLRVGESYMPFRVFGSYYREVKERGQPSIFETTDIEYELKNFSMSLDYENGILLFDYEPIFLVDNTDSFVPAELYLECCFEVKNQSNYAPIHYYKDVLFDVSGYGYHTVHMLHLFGKSIINYGAEHEPFGAPTTNQERLDIVAIKQAELLTPSLSTEVQQVKVYSIPKLSIRCDGAIMQVQHIITNGDGNYAVNRTRASRFREFDRGVPSKAERYAHSQAALHGAQRSWRDAIERRRDTTDE